MSPLLQAEGPDHACTDERTLSYCLFLGHCTQFLLILMLMHVLYCTLTVVRKDSSLHSMHLYQWEHGEVLIYNKGKWNMRAGLQVYMVS